MNVKTVIIALLAACLLAALVPGMAVAEATAKGEPLPTAKPIEVTETPTPEPAAQADPVTPNETA